MSKPRNEQKAAVAGVFDRGAESYDESGIDFFGPAGLDLVERAEPRPGEWVLDLGCGKGASALPAAHSVAADGRVLAVDLAPRMVAGLIARASAAAVGNLSVVVGDAESPPAREGSWDLVQSSLTLFFLPDLDAALERYRGLLHSGGRLAFSWFGDDDPRWSDVYGALTADIPDAEHGARRPGGSAFDSVDAIAAAVTQAGFTSVTTHEVQMRVAIPDGATWWRTQWTHGRRATLERVADLGALDATERRTVAAVEALRESDGTLEWRPVLRHTVAFA